MRSALATLTLVGLALAPALATAGGAAAGQPVFEHVHALALDATGRALWLGADAGLYRSEDGGRTWTKIALATQGHGPDVMAIAAHPSDANVLYVGTHDAGVLKSTDGGRTWLPANAGLGGQDVRGVAIDPRAPSKLHAHVRLKGLYRTATGGTGWIRVDFGPPGETNVLASVTRPTGMGGIFLYAGTEAGLEQSFDCF